MQRPRLLATYCAVAMTLWAGAPAAAQDKVTWSPLFLGYETEPGMDFGGRTLASLHTAVSRAIGEIGDVGKKHPGVTPAWEFPVGAAILLVQHEVGGHGGRGREFSLHPSYGFGVDFSGYTTVDTPPQTNEQGSLIAAGGAEADGIIAHRILREMLTAEGTDGAKVPLALMAKLDLTVYVASTEQPGDDFLDQYHEGNDVAYYLVSRQSARQAGDSRQVWDGVFPVDLGDRLLDRTYDHARATALWNALDPSLVAAGIAYFRQRVLGGETSVRMPALKVGEDISLMIGTRGALGPREVTRFLDLYAACRYGVLSVYARDLDSSTDRTYGFGAHLSGVRLGSVVTVGVKLDSWENPDAAEGPADQAGWNVAGEIDALFGRWGGRRGLRGSGGSGGVVSSWLPTEDWAHLGFGILAVWQGPCLAVVAKDGLLPG